MSVLEPYVIEGLASVAGFTGDAILWVTAIAMAESGGDPAATNVVGNTPPSTDRGLLQINSYWHPEVTDTEAFDPLLAMKAAYVISKQGTDFSPWATYPVQATIEYRKLVSMALIPEVAHFVDTSQFYPNKTEFACGFYAAATEKFSGKQAPTGTPADVEKWAEAEYTAMYGRDDISMLDGVTIDQEHTLINRAGCHYQDLLAINPGSAQDSDIAHVKAALQLGYSVIATITEVSVYDLDLGRNPYWWGASGTHVFVITGMQDANTYLVRDSANVVGTLDGPNHVQPGPRKYDATKLGIQWASMIQTPWLQKIPAGFDPTKDKLPPVQVTTPVASNPPQEQQMYLDKTKELIAGSHVEQQGKDIWQDMNSWNSGIAAIWKIALANGLRLGRPTSVEIATVDDAGSPILVRFFAMGARIEYQRNAPNTARLWVGVNEILFK